MARESRLDITLFGAPHVERDGARRTFDTRKAIALLARVAVAGRQRRDVLAALLWPEADDQRARGALRRTLSVLRSGVGDWLRVERDVVELADGAGVDVVRFRQLIARAGAHGHAPGASCSSCLRDLRTAAQMYAGDFLAGFALRDSPEFDDWQSYEAEGLRRELATALDRLVELENANAAPEAAISHGRRRVSIDPLHEPAQRSLMLLYARAGDRAAAIRQYRECVRVLDDELAVAPLPETTKLYESIAAGALEPSPLATPDDGANGTVLAELPFVGRAGDMDRILAARERRRSSGLLVTVEGEPGMGKTRLLHELAARLEHEGATTLVVSCSDAGAGTGFSRLLDVLRARLAAAAGLPDGLSRSARRGLTALWPDTPGRSDARGRSSPGGPTAQFFDALTELVRVVVGDGAAGMLIVDDLHLADPATFELIEFLAPRLARLRLQVAVSYRERGSEAAATIAGVVDAAVAKVETVMVRLLPLRAEDIAELARSLGIQRAAAVGARLARETDGTPLAVEQYLDAISLGDLRIDDPEWRVPGGERTLLLARLAGLSPIARQVLGAAAVLGDELRPDLLHEVSGRGEDEVVSAIEELVRQGLLREPGGRSAAGPGYRFMHRQVRSLATETLSHARVRLLHARAANALRQQEPGRSGRSIDVGRIATHLAAAGREAEAAEYHLAAATAARRVFAHAEAVDQYRAALALGHLDASVIHAAIGEVETVRGRYGEALIALERAAAHAAVAELPALERRLGTLHLRTGSWPMAAQHLAAALDVWPKTDRSGRARLLVDLALAEHRQGRDADASRHASQAVRAARASGDAVARAQAHNLGAILARASGHLETARSELGQALGLSSTVGDASVRVAVLNNAALVEREAGDLPRAVALTDEALALCAAIGDRHREAALRSNLADLFHLLGRREESMAVLSESVAIFAEIGEPGRMQPEIWKLVEW